MSSRNRSFKFDNDTKKFFVNGKEVSDGTADGAISANLSNSSQSSITTLGNLTSLNVAGTTSLFGNLVINSTVAASSTTTGAFRLAGGAGITGNLHAGNVISTGFNFANGSSILSVVTTAITTANTNLKGYVDAANTIQSNQVAGANTAITTANTNMKGYVDAQISNLVNGAPATLDTLNELAAALGNDANLSVTIANQIANVNSNIGTANTNIKGYIDAANTIQSNQIAGANSAIATANTNMKGYVDGLLTTITANTGVQAGLISSAEANIVTANTNMRGYVDSTIFSNVTVLGNRIDAANSAIATANTNLKGYVDGQISTTTSAIGTANTNLKGYTDSLVTTANTNLKGYVDSVINVGTYSNSNVASYLPTYSGNVAAGNVITGGIYTNNYYYANGLPLSLGVSGSNYSNIEVLAYLITYQYATQSDITTANTNLKGYVDGQISTTTSAIGTANTNLKGYVDGQISTVTSTVSTANTNMKGYVDGQITSLVNGAPSTLDTLNELATALGNDANLSVTITNQIANVNSNISTANTNMKGYVDSLSYGNTQVAAYLPTYSGNISASNLVVSGATISLGASLTSFPGVQIGRYLTGSSGSKLTVSNQFNGIFLEGGANAVIDLAGNDITLGQGGTGNTIVYHTGFKLEQSTNNIWSGSNGAGTTTFRGNLTVTRNLNLSGNLLAGGIKGSDGQILSATDTGLAWVNLGNSPLITDDNGTTVQTNGLFVNVEVDSSTVARFEPSKLTVLGNVHATSFVGDGSQLTGVVSEYGDPEVAAYLPTYNGNVANLTLNSTATIFAGNATANITIGSSTWGGAEPQNQKITIGGVGQKIYFNGNSSQYSYMDDDEFYIYDGKNNATAYYKANQFALNRNDYTGYFDAGPGTLTLGAYVGNDRSFVANLNMVTWGNATVRTTIGNTGITTTGNLSAGNVTATNLTGTLLTAAQTNITSVGNLTSLSASGTIQTTGIVYANATTVSTSSSTGALRVAGGVGVAGNVYTGGIVDITSTAASTSTSTGALIVDGGAGIAGNVNAGNVSATNLTGTLLTASQTNITGVGTVTTGTWNAGAVTSSGTITANTATGRVQLGTDAGGSISMGPNINSATTPYIDFNTSATLVDYDVRIQASGNVGTVGKGNLTITAGNVVMTSADTFVNRLFVNSGSGVTAIVNSGTAGVGNIGASGAGFNTVFARATSAQYADLAEIYTSDRDYVPGTVVIFGGEKEVTVSTESHDPRVAGVVSTNPAYLMNNACDGVEVALQGRVPCKVLGPVTKGDRLVTSTVQGAAQRLSMSYYQPGCIIGKALESVPEGEIATIEVVVGRV